MPDVPPDEHPGCGIGGKTTNPWWLERATEVSAATAVDPLIQEYCA